MYTSLTGWFHWEPVPCKDPNLNCCLRYLHVGFLSGFNFNLFELNLIRGVEALKCYMVQCVITPVSLYTSLILRIMTTNLQICCRGAGLLGPLIYLSAFILHFVRSSIMGEDVLCRSKSIAFQLPSIKAALMSWFREISGWEKVTF